MLLKEFSPRLHLFDINTVKYSNILKYYYDLKYILYLNIYFKMYFISVIKAVFSAALFQSSVSHDPSEIIIIFRFAAQ